MESAGVWLYARVVDISVVFVSEIERVSPANK